jgi:hypothetical protein
MMKTITVVLDTGSDGHGGHSKAAIEQTKKAMENGIKKNGIPLKGFKGEVIGYVSSVYIDVKTGYLMGVIELLPGVSDEMIKYIKGDYKLPSDLVSFGKRV